MFREPKTNEQSGCRRQDNRNPTSYMLSVHAPHDAQWRLKCQVWDWGTVSNPLSQSLHRRTFPRYTC